MRMQQLVKQQSIMVALLKSVVLIYNSAGKCTEDLNDLYFKYCYFFAFLSYMDAPLLLFIVYPTARDNGNFPY